MTIEETIVAALAIVGAITVAIILSRIVFRVLATIVEWVSWW